MSKTIAIMGTLDTKGDQIEYLRKKIEQKGCPVMVIDIGVLGKPSCNASISRHQIAEASGMTLEKIQEMGPGKEGRAMDKMAEGTRKILKDLCAQKKMNGLLALGGTMGTDLALKVIDVLPLFMPKVLLSTIANSPAIDSDIYGNNVIMLPWIGGLWGINEITKIILDQAAGVVLGASEAYSGPLPLKKKMIGVVSFGASAARFLSHLRPALEKKGYDVAVFHATGMSVRLLERAIKEGQIDVVLELCAGHELVDEIYGSSFSPGPKRFEAAAERGIPQIMAIGSMELTCWGTNKAVPEKISGSPRFEHNSLLWVVYTALEERLKAARMLAEKLNKATGPAALIVPMKSGFGLTKHGLDDPEGLKAIRDELKKHLKSEIKVLEVNASEEDPKYSEAVIALLDGIMNFQSV